MVDDLTEILAGARLPGQGTQRPDGSVRPGVHGPSPGRGRMPGAGPADPPAQGAGPVRSRHRGSGAGEGGVAADGAAAGGGAAFVGRQIASRAQVYQQLAAAAAVLQRLEPHSPIPYLINRAVELGALSFPELMRAAHPRLRRADCDESRAGDQAECRRNERAVRFARLAGWDRPRATRHPLSRRGMFGFRRPPRSRTGAPVVIRMRPAGREWAGWKTGRAAPLYPTASSNHPSGGRRPDDQRIGPKPDRVRVSRSSDHRADRAPDRAARRRIARDFVRLRPAFWKYPCRAAEAGLILHDAGSIDAPMRKC